METSLPEPMKSLQDRISLTVSCRDADMMPRTPRAGQVVFDEDFQTSVQIMHNGIKVKADGYCGPWMTDLIKKLDGVHEPQEEAAFQSLMEHLPQAKTMVEIGSYWSFYTLWFLSLAPEIRKGLGLEMDPKHIEVGDINMRLNGLEMDVIQGRIGSENAGPKTFDTESSGPQEVPTYSLQGLMDVAGMRRADLVLCDAQGGEIDLLMGIDSLVDENRVGVVIISTHHHLITGSPLTHQTALNLIERIGGRVALEHDVAESFSGDGLVIADFDNSLDRWTPPEISRCRTSKSLFRDPLYDLAEANSRHDAILNSLVKTHADELQAIEAENMRLVRESERLASQTQDAREKKNFLRKLFG